MTINYSQDITSLYCLIGEAVCMIQHLEGALSVSITLKKDIQSPGRISKKNADDFLQENLSFTLGKAIKLSKKNGLYSDILYNELDSFLDERNWLVHKFLQQHLDDIHVISKRDRLFHRIKTISNNAKMLKEIIEADLIEFSESVGVDMTKVRAYVKKYSNEV